MIRLLRILNIFNIAVKAYDVFKKLTKKKPEEIELTRTDKLIDASLMADRIRDDMQSCGMIVLSMMDHEVEVGNEVDVGIESVFRDMGMNEPTIKNVIEWVEKANFTWACYADALKILRSELPPEQLKDVRKHKIKNKPKTVSARKLKKIHDKYAEEDEVKNQAGLEALEKLSKDLERVAKLREEKEKVGE